MNKALHLRLQYSRPLIPNTGRGGVASSRSCVPNHQENCSSWSWPSARSVRHHFCRSHARSVMALAQLSEHTEIEAGLLVEFRRDQKSGLALLREPDGAKNWKAVDSRGHVYSLRPQQIGYILPGTDYTDSDLQSVYEQSNQHLEERDELMHSAWEYVNEETDKLYSVPQMAELLFSDKGSVSCYAAHRLLNEDRTYFKQSGRFPPVFTPRPAAEVERLKTKLVLEQQKAKEATELQNALWTAACKAFGEKPSVQEWSSGPWRDYLLAIQEHAIKGSTSVADASATVAQTMSPLTRGSITPQAAGELLRRLGFWYPHQQLAPLRAGLTETFPANIEEEAAQLLKEQAADEDAGRRRDLRHLDVWAIDSEDTTEVDDAISIETLADGSQRYWVHVADPTRWLLRGSLLEKEAARRTCSLYLPTGSVPMFPRSVAENLFSLRPGEECCAFSISIELDKDGKIVDCQALNSIVQPKRMTYKALDQQLRNNLHPEFNAFREVSELRQQWRIKQGAVTINLPDCEVRVRNAASADPDIYFQGSEISESPARLAVSEFMIMANEACAKIGSDAGIALPYRGQAAIVQPSEEELEAVGEGDCRYYLLRSRMTRSVCTTAKPLAHAGLGLPCYAQSTSPIRRYTDLLVHWQIKAHLRGEQPPFTADSLNEIVEEVYSRSRDNVLVTREVSKYYLVQYFGKQMRLDPSITYPAKLLGWIREDIGIGIVLFDETGLETSCRINKPTRLGEKLLVRCTRAEVQSSELEFEEATVSLYNSTQAGDSEALTDIEDNTEISEAGADKALDSSLDYV